MENLIRTEATCDNCARVFNTTVKRHYCAHCDKFFYICSSCADVEAKCRFCGVPLKKRTEPQFTPAARRRVQQRA